MGENLGVSEMFRCTLASRGDHEPMVGTAPADTRYLLLEYAGAWGKQALRDSRLPEGVKERLGALRGVNVLLVRRPGGRSGEGVRLFAVAVTPTEATITATTLPGTAAVLDLDLEGFAETGVLPGLEPWDGDLHLVCTNGSRDLCCAEMGRPVAAAVAARWPEETWECTHLGGHRFSATLLTLPSAICLGRLDTESAVMALEEIEVGRHPLGFTRGRAGLSGAAQVAMVHVMEAAGLDDLGDVTVLDEEMDEESGVVRLRDRTDEGHVEWRAGVGRRSVERRQSCGDSPLKPATSYQVLAAGPVG